MRASSGYKALLRVLYLRKDSAHETDIDVDQILWDLRGIASRLGTSYGFVSFGNARSFNHRHDNLQKKTSPYQWLILSIYTGQSKLLLYQRL